ncbi:LysR family transcriptional regulator [Frigidibacter oleivorans]|uniref:LysR family transcriptional regulator n=1 Tax=Frigidibacter oleivorans TaxID=2487129 RepID=UPI000F8D5701|nr:LysR family transcriptional regulator [Frigidibacter oleivorans]
MIDKLEMFLALARERHFGRAALAVGVTQPTLSSAIRQLEETLGVQLVQRGSRFQGLTPEGERLLDRARRIVADTRALKDEMRAARQGLSGMLRIGVIPTALPRIAELTAPLLARGPDLRLTVLSRTSDGILAGIEALELDAGVTYLDNEPTGRLAQLPLWRESLRLLVSSRDPRAERAEVTWDEVAGLPLCLLTPDMQNRRIVDRHLSRAGQPPVPQVETNSTIALAAHVATGRWGSVVPEALAVLFARSADLAAVPIAGVGASHVVGLVAPLRAPHPPLLAALVAAAERLGKAR